jgi:thiol-disulfide isomerase/thioredoxin
LFALCAVALTAGCWSGERSTSPSTGVNVNQNVSTLGGWDLPEAKRASIADYKGKVLLLDFYATWCQPCRVETPHLVALHQKYEAQGLQIVGLNVGGADDYAEVPAYKQEFGIQYPLGIPDDELVDQLLGMNQNIPQTFVIDRQGQLVKHFVGFNDARGPDFERVIQNVLAQQ